MHLGAGGPGGGGSGGQAGIIIGFRVGESSEQAIVFCCKAFVYALCESYAAEAAAAAIICLARACVTPPPFSNVPFIVAVKRVIREFSVCVIGVCIDSFT